MKCIKLRICNKLVHGRFEELYIVGNVLEMRREGYLILEFD